MPKAFYEEFAARSFRFYVHNPAIQKSSLTLSKYKSWAACDIVFLQLSNFEREIITRSYFCKEPICDDTVKKVAAQMKCSENTVWRAINKAQRLYAKERGLL